MNKKIIPKIKKDKKEDITLNVGKDKINIAKMESINSEIFEIPFMLVMVVFNMFSGNNFVRIECPQNAIEIINKDITNPSPISAKKL